MQTVSVAQAQENLVALVNRALGGEQVMIRHGSSGVVLQPVNEATFREGKKLTPLEALERLQEFNTPSPEEAEAYMREVYAERRAP